VMLAVAEAHHLVPDACERSACCLASCKRSGLAASIMFMHKNPSRNPTRVEKTALRQPCQSAGEKRETPTAPWDYRNGSC
jgi:hypothetical protein